MLYFHKDKDGSDMFFSGKKSSNETKGEINLKEVVSVRVSPVGPGTSGHRGIELESCLSGKVWTIVPEGDAGVFEGWLTVLRDTVGRQNGAMYDRTGDPELRKDVKDVRSSALGTRSKDMFRAEMLDVDAYNVDVREAAVEVDEEDGIAWDVEAVSDDVDDVSSTAGKDEKDVKDVKVCETREASLLA